jgi:hypothetical protein
MSVEGMDVPRDLGWVNDIDHKRVSVFSPDRRHDGLLRKLRGGKSWLWTFWAWPWKLWDLPYRSDQQLAEILIALRDAGYPFLGEEHGWPPTAIFEDLRDKGLLSGPFREITWLGPGRPILIDHP